MNIRGLITLCSGKRLIALFLCLLWQFAFGASPVLLNEIVSSNINSMFDEDGDSSDWIEIYNASGSAVNLAGYFLSDNISKPEKWRFPDILMQPHSFLLVFASAKDRYDTSELHANFKISSAGESLLLTSPSGTTADSLWIPSLSPDQSFGRLPDGGPQWLRLSHSTPGAGNDASEVVHSLLPPVLSQSSGFYDQPVLLEISHNEPDVLLFYTLDGSLPDSSADLYTAPFFVDTTTVLRCAAMRADGVMSGVKTATLIVNESFHLPVIALATDPYNLWDADYGIYAKGDNAQDKYPYKGANFWRECERPVHIEFFETDQSLAFTADAGVRIFGHSSVGAPFKPLAFYARKKYGVGSFKYQIFPQKGIAEFESFMLRNSGNDWNRTLFRDAFMHTLASEINLPGQAYRPAVVFLNGTYWGIQNLRERMNEHYVASNFHVDADNIDLTAWNYGFQVYAGDSLAFHELKTFVQQHDLADAENYHLAASKIHLDNYIDYFIMEIFCNNRDWPFNNQYMWRPRTTGGRWMWLLKDMDHGFGYEVSYNYNSLVRNALKDDLFSSFLENSEFRQKFVSRFAFLLNTTFQPAHLRSLIAQIKSKLEPEISRHVQRWAVVETFGNPPTTMAEWQAYCDDLNQFADLRLAAVQQQLRDYFHLGEMATVSINVESPEMGALSLDNQSLPSAPWHGEFFVGTPINLQATARTGYRFTGWKGLDAGADTVTFTPQADMDITAQFSRINSQGVSLVINEINYNSANRFDPGDWIELANPTDVSLKLDGWTMRDNQDGHIFHFPHGTIVPPFSFLVVCRDKQRFSKLFPSVQDAVGDLGFGLSSSGDAVRLYDDYGALVDAAAFRNSGQWPDGANGHGASLALSFPFADNAAASNWFASFPHGTPGQANIKIAPIQIKSLAMLDNDGQTIGLCWQATRSDVGNIFRVQMLEQGRWKTISDGQGIRLTADNEFQFVNRAVAAGSTFRLEYTNSDGALAHSEILFANTAGAVENIQFDNFPNPFNNSTVIRFVIEKDQNVDIKVFNVRGQLVAYLAAKEFVAGAHDIVWHAGDLPSGLYFCKIETPAFTEIKKLTLQK